VEDEGIRMDEVTAAGLSDERINDPSLAAVASIPIYEEGLDIKGEDTFGEDMESDRLRLPDTVVNVEGESIRMENVAAVGLCEKRICDLPIEEEGLGIKGEGTLDEDMESDRLRLPGAVADVEGESIRMDEGTAADSRDERIYDPSLTAVANISIEEEGLGMTEKTIWIRIWNLTDCV
jgi:hypothetical protein